MPCLFITDFAADVPDADALIRLHEDLSKIDPGGFEIHNSGIQHAIWHPDGSVGRSPDIHVFVLGHARNLKVKDAIQKRFKQFLDEIGVEGLGVDVTFFDMPAETFFLNGEMVPGGPLRR